MRMTAARPTYRKIDMKRAIESVKAGGVTVSRADLRRFAKKTG